MADDDFSRVIINPRERPLSVDINRGNAQMDRTIRDVMVWDTVVRGVSSATAAFSAVGFQSLGFYPLASGIDMTVSLLAGLGYQFNPSDAPVNINSANGVDDPSPLKPLVLNNSQILNVPAADPTDPRIDLIEVRYNRIATDPSSRSVLNLISGQFDPTLVNKTLSFSLDGLVSTNGSQPINYKVGTPAPSPSAPPTSPGYVAIARVNVAAGATAITTSDVVDLRPIQFSNGVGSASVRFFIPTSGAFGPPTGVEVNAPAGVRIVVVSATATTYQAAVSIWAGKNQQISAAFQATNGVVSVANVAFLSVSNHVAQLADAGVQASFASANARPIGATIGVGQPMVTYLVTPTRLNNGGTISQASLPDPIEITGVFTILGGSQ